MACRHPGFGSLPVPEIVWRSRRLRIRCIEPGWSDRPGLSDSTSTWPGSVPGTARGQCSMCHTSGHTETGWMDRISGHYSGSNILAGSVQWPQPEQWTRSLLTYHTQLWWTGRPYRWRNTSPASACSKTTFDPLEGSSSRAPRNISG